MRLFLTGLTVLALCGVANADARSRSTRNTVDRLLAIAETPEPSSAAEARALYDGWHKSQADDARVEIAYAATLVQLRRYRDARAVLLDYLKSNRDDVSARMLKIRASLGDQRPSEAIEDTETLIDQLTAGGRPIEPKTRQRVARFLGYAFGYLELARPDKAEAARRLSAKNRLMSSLTNPEIEQFDLGRGDVAERVTKLEGEMESERQRIARLEKRQADDMQADLDKTREKLEDHAETTQSSQETAADAQREAEVLGLQLTTLRNERARVGARFVALQTQLQMLSTASSSNFVDQTRPNDPTPTTTTTTTSTRIALERLGQANAVAMQLAAVNRQALDMDRKILALQSRLGEVSDKFDKSAKSIEKSDAASREIERKAKIAEKKLKQKPRTSNARIAALKSQLANFSTYAPFDYAAEKERVLSLFDE